MTGRLAQLFFSPQLAWLGVLSLALVSLWRLQDQPFEELSLQPVKVESLVEDPSPQAPDQLVTSGAPGAMGAEVIEQPSPAQVASPPEVKREELAKPERSPQRDEQEAEPAADPAASQASGGVPVRPGAHPVRDRSDAMRSNGRAGLPRRPRRRLLRLWLPERTRREALLSLDVAGVRAHRGAGGRRGAGHDRAELQHGGGSPSG